MEKIAKNLKKLNDSKLIQEPSDQLNINHHGKTEPEDGAQQVCVVVDVIVRLACRIPRVEKVKRSENVRFDGKDAHEQQRHVGLEKNAAKQHCRHSARSPNGIVPNIVLMLVQRGKRRYDNACQIENNVPQYREVHPRFERHKPEKCLNGIAK